MSLLIPLLLFCSSANTNSLNFSGRFSYELAVENVIEAAVMSHPSGITVPTDLEILIEKSKVPLLINACETDGTVRFLLLALSSPSCIQSLKLY